MQDKRVDIGSVKHLSVDIEKPCKYKDLNLELNALTLLTGQNGVGKTFFLVANYAMIMSTSIIVNGMKEKLLVEQIAEGVQYIFDHCYTDQDIDGTMGISWSGGSSISVTFLNGKVVDIIWTNLTEYHVVPPAIFMSSTMRLFSGMQGYLKLRKMVIDADPEKNSMLIYPEMMKHYKMYDVMYIEGLIYKMPMKMEEKHWAWMRGYDYNEKILFFDVDLDKCRYFVAIDDDTNIKWVDTFGNGHQAIFNMLLGVS